MAKQYGRTWWGQQWLKALDRIDFSNRLPRGRSYANNGKVKNINFEDSGIRAKVLGSRSSPYDVAIIAPPFTEKEKKALVRGIKNDPLVLSQLLNRHLPNELLAIAETNHIKIFPQTWHDLKLNCSCPDWAVPCKHLAAVIYLVADEIDQNPFRVFSLHGFDIVKELAKERLQMYEMEKEEIFSLESLQEQQAIAVKTKKIESPEIPDFSLIEDLQNSLTMLFPASPLFFSTDFKTNIQNFYKKRSKAEPTYLSSLKQQLMKLPNEFRFYEYIFAVDGNGDFDLRVKDEKGKEHTIAVDDLLVMIAQTDSKHLPNYSPTFIALYRTFRFCNILTERGALLPRLLDCGNGTYRIQWIPALINPSVKSVFDKLTTWCQPGSVILKTLNKTKTKKKSAEGYSLSQANSITWLCAFFCGKSIESKADRTTLPLKTESDNKILSLFFGNERIAFDGFTEKEIPNTIQLWLKRFFLGKKNFSPLLQVHEQSNSKDVFEVEVLMRDNNNPMQTVQSLLAFMEDQQQNQLDALKDLQLLSHYMPELNSVISTGGKQRLHYNSTTFSEVLMSILPAIRMLGIETLLPKSLQHLLRPKISMVLKSKTKGKSFFSLHEMLDFNWKIAIGDKFIDVNEFKKLSKETSGLVKIRDQYVMMSKEEIERIIKKLESPEAPTSVELLQAALSEDYNGATVQIDPELRAQIREIAKTDLVDIPKGILASLRPYQHRGFSWMYKNAKLGLGSLLADDMGLGKTLQVITTLLKFKEEGLLTDKPALVIAPTTLLSNWHNEISKFAPDLKATIYHGTGRSDSFKNTDVVITTYGVARSDNAKLCKLPWHVLIVDEAQNIKNNNIAQTKSVKNIPATVKIAMTGTPVENRLSEYWSIFDFANRKYLGSEQWFETNYAHAIEINHDKARLNKFLKITAPFILRRVKTDKTIISDLPDKIENNQYCNLSQEQAAIYKNLTADLLVEVEQADGIERKGLILKLLMGLKQLCNHPMQYLKSKGDLRPEHSGKMLLLLQLLETIYENNEKVLVFSQFKEAGTLLQRVIYEYFGKKVLQLHGGCSRKERDDMVTAFQNSSMHDTFILSLKAGGTGLNLTAANHVIHFDLWWNPAAEAQATDRAFRIGQKKNVMVHRLITKGTLEEKIDAMLKSKKNLANMTVAGGEKWIGNLSDKDIKELVALSE
jgi:SNF2 family DNA or RNA helicase/uncharacterized Zn finger protein